MDADDDPLLGDYLDEWLDRRRSQLRPSTMHGYRQTVDCYLRPPLGDEPLSALGRRRLERLYARLLTSGGVNGKPLSPRTVQLTHAVLHRALKDAQLDGLLERNPAALARTPRRDPREVEADDDLQVWTAQEATRFLDLVDEHPWRVLWHLALGTGGDDWRDQWGLVLTDSRGRHLDPLTVTHEFRDLVRALDVPVIRLHDLRHTSASLLLQQGVAPKVVSERLGHTTISMTMDIYAHILPAMDQDAAARLEATLHGACDRSGQPHDS